MKTVIFPGSFDPFTKGHEAIVGQALALFDKVIIAIGENVGKSHRLQLSKSKVLTVWDCLSIWQTL